MESSHSFHETSNPEAGPSRHVNALGTDHQHLGSLLRGLDLRTLGRCRGVSQDVVVAEDDEHGEMEEETPVAMDKKGKKPMRPKKYLCLREDCDKSFSKPAKLREHELSHTGEVSTASPGFGIALIEHYHIRDHTSAPNAEQVIFVHLTSLHTRGRICRRRRKRSSVRMLDVRSGSGRLSIRAGMRNFMRFRSNMK